MEADLLIHVRDIAHPDTEYQANDVYSILDQLGSELAAELPAIIEVWNKADALDEASMRLLSDRAHAHHPPALLVSALTGEGIPELLFRIEAELFKGRRLRRVTIPAADGRLHAWLHKNSEVASEMLEGETDLLLEAYMSDQDVAKLRALSPDIRIAD
jgi:GTP-binding protein HflX